MPKIFTLPTDLLTQTTALTELEPCDLLYQSQLMNFLAEEFEDVSFSPSESSVKNILDYSKAVEVKSSKTMVNDHVVIMN
jgi:hypothetical protein